MDRALFLISANRQVGSFLKWATDEKGQSFSHELFNRTKQRIGKRMTDRQKLLIELAAEYNEALLCESAGE